MLRNLLKSGPKISNVAEMVGLVQKRHAGHSKWQNIRHIKGAKDAQRAILFSKISRQMKVAVQEGGSADIKKNLKLENIVEQAKRANMPQATIQSVLKSIEGDKTNSKPHLIEIRGPGSCIILCEVFTSNIHHLRQGISTILRKHSCKYSDGGGMHLFEEKGIIEADFLNENQTKSAEESLEIATEHAIESGAEDVIVTDETLQFICGKTNLKAVVAALENFKYSIRSASVEYIPIKTQELTESELEVCSSLYEKLEGLPELVRLSDNIA